MASFRRVAVFGVLLSSLGFMMFFDVTGAVMCIPGEQRGLLSRSCACVPVGCKLAAVTLASRLVYEQVA
jgi:hypothetical protein